MVTIKDVARHAGVSVKTVSRVLTGNGYASQEARRKVEQAVKRLGYVPNRAASSLVTGRTMTIGMVVPNISSAFYPLIVLGTETTARQVGYNTLLCNTATDPEQEKRILKYLHEARVDGVIIVSTRLAESELLPALAQFRAVVSINHPIPAQVGANVSSDNVKGMALAVEHLIRSGRRVIGYMGGPEGVYTAQERLRGFIQAMKGASCPINPNLIIPYAANLEEGYHTIAEMLWPEGDDPSAWNAARAYLGRRGAHHLLTQHPEVNGLVCFDDQLAFGALRACGELERRVPEDVAIIGCNDIPLASQVSPALTTQRIPAFQMGVRAAQLLLAQIKGHCESEPVLFPHELIIRASAPDIAQSNRILNS